MFRAYLDKRYHLLEIFHNHLFSIIATRISVTRAEEKYVQEQMDTYNKLLYANLVSLGPKQVHEKKQYNEEEKNSTKNNI